MSKKNLATKKSPAAAKSVTPAAATAAGPSAMRKFVHEVLETVVVALVAALFARTFVFEPFVIPTGSMAPTLMGAHKDLLCPQCGFRYQAGASSESDDMAQQLGRMREGAEVVEVTCPLCRYGANVDPRTPEGSDHPTYAGDRILVNKFTYEFWAPRRWDIPVFKFPGGASENYIKRLVGLPKETVRLRHGDVYIKPDGQPDAKIERRPPDKIRAMAQLVYDNDYVVQSMTEKGWPLRWQATAESKGGWASADGGRSFAIDGSTGDEQSIRYRHFTPSIDDWRELRQGALGPDFKAKPRLITDFYAYDTGVQRRFEADPAQRAAAAQLLGLHWVGDLLVECDLDVRGGGGTAWLDLVKGGKHFRCTFNCDTGEARLSVDGLPDFHPTAKTAVTGGSKHHVAFANIDEQLTLWVDGRPVTFDAPTEYPQLSNDYPQSTADDPGDLAPAGIGSKSCALAVSHLKLWRDLYYIATNHSMGPLADYEPELARQGVPFPPGMDYQQLLAFWSTPSQWHPEEGKPSPFDMRGEVSFPLAENQFFVLGDNSPMSADARLWREPFVERDLLVGQAVIVFWPHTFHRIPGTPIPFPFFPNFARMGLIR